MESLKKSASKNTCKEQSAPRGVDQGESVSAGGGFESPPPVPSGGRCLADRLADGLAELHGALAAGLARLSEEQKTLLAEVRQVREGLGLRQPAEVVSPVEGPFYPRQFHPDERLESESLRLRQIEGSNHVLLVRGFEIKGAHVWFEPPSPLGLCAVHLWFTCPDGYPFQRPELVVRSEGAELDEENGYIIWRWDASFWLADIVQDLLILLPEDQTFFDKED